MSKRTRFLRVSLVVGVVVNVSALTATSLAAEPLKFSHSEHMEDADDCKTCHTETGRAAVNKEACSDCHDDGAPSPYEVIGKAKRLQLAVFPHDTHTDSFACKDCHEATASDQQRPDARILEPTRCLACHEEEGGGPGKDDCHTCHSGKALDQIKPSYHDRGWPTQHGPTLKAGKLSGLHGGKCGACHDQENFCMRCHQAKRAISHAAHLGDRGADCDMCHSGTAPDGFPKLNIDGCSDCHDGPIQTKLLRSRGRRLAVQFPHAAHTKKVKECKTCHAATLEDRQPSGEPLVPEKGCQSCHDDRHVKVAPSACQACHGYDRKRAAPADHKQNWRVRHGLESRRRMADEHGKRCAQCHSRSKCVSCHQSTTPRTHTGLWRTRTHGVAAGFDRSTCKTCHETGTCVGCHRRTAPLSHRGAWGSIHGLVAGSKSNDRCLVCHQQSYCTRCHEGQGGAR